MPIIAQAVTRAWTTSADPPSDANVRRPQRQTAERTLNPARRCWSSRCALTPAIRELQRGWINTAFRTGWRPGLPVVTEQDHAEWQTWRRNRVLELQRARRRSLRRLDYYPSKAVAAVIDGLRMPRAGGGCQL